MLDAPKRINLRWPLRPRHRPCLATREDYADFAARYGHQTAARSETVKFAIDLQDAARTYFFDSNRFGTHYRFIERYVDARADYAMFLAREFTREDRRFVLGSVMHYIDGDHWTLELSSNDTLAGERLVWLHEHISSRIHFKCDLRFRPVSSSQIALAQALGNRLPSLSREAINADLVYQPVVLGIAFGHLLRIRGALDVSALRPCDVVITDEVPNEIPPVAALVTSQLQAPLAHVAILCRSRNTPDMAHRGAIDLDQFSALEGELVKLTVGGQDFSIERAEPGQAEAAWASVRPAAVHTPEVDFSVQGIQEVHSLSRDAASFVGAKAAQLGRLCGIEGVSTPDGFAIPFSAYARHLETAGLNARIDALLGDASFRANPATRAEHLAELRDSILSHPVEPALLEQVWQRVSVALPQQRWIFRSSSNAEDIAGFSGAGLYESVLAASLVANQQIADALRSVWASVWLQRAFEERDWYRIDQRRVAMAVLVQPFIEGASASGVAITGNPFQRGPGALINAQVQGHTVTGAIGNEMPEQVLVTRWSGEYEFELLNKSSLANGDLLLHEAELRSLVEQLFAIHDHMLPSASGDANAMDVEFLLTQQRHIVIVQARPYTLVHNVDRGVTSPYEKGLTNFLRILRGVAYRFIPNRLAYRPSR
jgi:hypothetical protein